MELSDQEYPMGTIDIFPLLPGEYKDEDSDDSGDSFRYPIEDARLFADDAAILCWDTEEDDLDSADFGYLRSLSKEVVSSMVRSVCRDIADSLIASILERCLEAAGSSHFSNIFRLSPI